MSVLLKCLRFHSHSHSYSLSFISFLFFLISSLLQLTSAALPILHNNILKRYYVNDASVINQTKNEMLYIQLKYYDSNSTSKNSKFISYFDINVFWFSMNSIANFTTGLFYGVGQTKQVSETVQVTDFVICKLYLYYKRCDDYLYTSLPDNTLNQSIHTNFNPVLDTAKGGTNDLFNYLAKDPITSYLELYNLGFDYKITKKLYSDDKNDVDFDFKNNLTFVYGSLGIDNQIYFFEKPNYKVFSVESVSIARIYTEKSISTTTASTTSGSKVFKLNFAFFLCISILALI